MPNGSTARQLLEMARSGSYDYEAPKRLRPARRHGGHRRSRRHRASGRTFWGDRPTIHQLLEMARGGSYDLLTSRRRSFVKLFNSNTESSAV
jgi:hypothetical protein